ncbi:MAG: hypothetical protein WCK35_18790 [Chloroflexota bacterium]
MKKQFIFSIMVFLVFIFTVGCSKDNTTGQMDPSKPQPQVRIEIKPSPSTVVIATALNPETTSEAIVTVTPAQLLYDPTPDSDAIANQIESMMDEIDRKLKSENFQLK